MSLLFSTLISLSDCCVFRWNHAPADQLARHFTYKEHRLVLRPFTDTWQYVKIQFKKRNDRSCHPSCKIDEVFRVVRNENEIKLTGTPKNHRHLILWMLSLRIWRTPGYASLHHAGLCSKRSGWSLPGMTEITRLSCPQDHNPVRHAVTPTAGIYFR